jgi:chromate transporter
MSATSSEAFPSLREAFWVWAKIGFLSFGGPAGQIALMHKELVEDRNWISEARFLHALNYCMLLPGPEAMQLATYIGWLMHRTAGGLMAGLLFILPGAVTMMALSAVYVLYSDVGFVEAVFFGIKAAVVAIVIEALIKIARKALTSKSKIILAAMAFIALAVFAVPFPVVVLGAGLAGLLLLRAGKSATEDAAYTTQDNLVDSLLAEGRLGHATPSSAKAIRTASLWLSVWLVPVAGLVLIFGWSSFWSQLAVFFSTMAVVTFGGAYAVLAYVAQASVETYGWLAPGDMLDGLGLAETTPGPLVLVLQFVGFIAGTNTVMALPPLVTGFFAACIVLWVTFAPCFLWIFLGGPYIETLQNNQTIKAALEAITAAIVGVIANLAFWFALHVLFSDVKKIKTAVVSIHSPDWASYDLSAALIVVLAICLMRFAKFGVLSTLGICALAGLVFFFA